MIAQSGCTRPGRSCKLKTGDEEKRTQEEREERN